MVSPRIELKPIVPPPAFPGLQAAEQAYLRHWAHAAKAMGIDAVEDMLSRPWPCPIGDTIIGVFRRGSDKATWLIVGDAGQWAVACCDSGDVSSSVDSLVDALALVCPAEADFTSAI